MCPETNALHLILQAIIIDGAQRMRPEADIKTNAEAAAKAFRAGLAAFTAPPEAVAGGRTNASIPVTVNYGGAKDALRDHAQRCNRMATLAGCADRDPAQHRRAGDTAPVVEDPFAGIQAHMAAAAKMNASDMHRLSQLANAAANLPINRTASAGAQSCDSMSNANSLAGYANRTPDRDALVALLTQVIAHSSAVCPSDPSTAAEAAATAFRISLASFDAAIPGPV